MNFCRIRRELREKNFSFFTYEDAYEKVIIVKTTNEHTVLNYVFDKDGMFKNMFYSCSSYEHLLDTILHANLYTCQFERIEEYHGGNKAKGREIAPEEIELEGY